MRISHLHSGKGDFLMGTAGLIFQHPNFVLLELNPVRTDEMRWITYSWTSLKLSRTRKYSSSTLSKLDKQDVVESLEGCPQTDFKYMDSASHTIGDNDTCPKHNPDTKHCYGEEWAAKLFDYFLSLFSIYPLSCSKPGSACLNICSLIWMELRGSKITIQYTKPSFFRSAFSSLPINLDTQTEDAH